MEQMTVYIIYDIKDGNQVIEKMQERLLGRYAVDDVYNPNTNELIVDNRYNDYRKYSRKNSICRNRKTRSSFSTRMSEQNMVYVKNAMEWD